VKRLIFFGSYGKRKEETMGCVKSIRLLIALCLVTGLSVGLTKLVLAEDKKLPPGIAKKEETPGKGSHKGWEIGKHKGWDKEKATAGKDEKVKKEKSEKGEKVESTDKESKKEDKTERKEIKKSSESGPKKGAGKK
jgi:hypothetical protein